MRAGVFLMAVVPLLLCLAMAGGAYAGGCGVTPGLSVDWSWHRGDEGEGVGVTGRGLIPLCCGDLMLDVGWANGHSVDVVGSTMLDAASRQNGFTVQSFPTDVWSISGSFIRTEEREDDWDLYYGAGVGWHKVKGDDFEEDSFGGQVILGATCESNWFVETRWVFDTEFDWGGGETSEVDGIRFSVGRWFK